MAEKCRAWLRKYCCDVFIHCSSKTTTDVYQECNAAAQEQISEKHDICDRSTPCSAEVGLPVKQNDTISTDVDVTSTSCSTATVPLDCQKRQKKTIKPKSQSLRLKSHGVKLPGLSSIRLQRSSLSIDDEIANENSYCNVDFNKRLIKMFNMQISKAENKQADDKDESENVVPSPEKIYDDVYEATEEGLKTNKENEDVIEGWEENPEYDKSKSFQESVPQLLYDTIPLKGDSKQDPNSPTFLMTDSSNNSFKDSPDKETIIYDDIDQKHLYVNELQVSSTGEGFVHENKTTLRSKMDSEHVYINDDRSVDTEWDKNIAYAEIPADELAGKEHAVEEGWEDNIAYVGLLSTDALTGKEHAVEEGWEDNIAYVGLLSTDALAGKEHTVEEGWEENIAYAGIGNVDALLGMYHVGEGITRKYAYDDVFIDMEHDASEEGWEENTAYHSRNNNLPVVCKTPSVRSDNCSHGAVRASSSTSEANGGKRSRAYTESMVMRNNFQRDLRMAINLRAHKTSLPIEPNQVSSNESYDNVDSPGTL